MTINVGNARATFLCDGSTKIFPIPIQAYLATDITVTLTAPASVGGAESTLTLNSDYSLAQSGTLAPTQWTLTTLATNAFAAGYVLQAFCNPPQSQQAQFVQGQSFPSLAVQTAFDRLTQMVQRLQDEQSRSIQAPDSDVNPLMLLPIAAQRANTGLGFDGNGNLIAAQSLPPGSLSRTSIGNLLYPQSSAEGIIGVTPSDLGYPVGNVKRYGAAGDGVTDDTAAIKTAWLVVKQQGGGTIVFPKATYLCASLDATNPSVNLPQQQSNGSQAYQPYQTQFYFQSGSHINFDFQGSILQTTVTGGGAFMMFDNCTDIRLLGPTVTGAQVMASGITGLGTISGGSGYTNGSYNNVLLTGGTGNGAVAGIVVSGGAVVSVTPVYVGGNYVVGDVLSASVPGGSGFSVPVTSVTGAGPVVQVAAPACFVCTAVSGSTTRVSIADADISSMFIGVYCVADPTLAPTVTQVTLTGNCKVSNCEYGIAYHNAGDDSDIQNLYTFRPNRPFFFYGVQNLRATIVGDQVAYGFQPVVKAYARSCRNLAIRYAMINAPGQSGSVARLSFQVQCDPAVISPPPFVEQVDLYYDEANVSGNGGNGIEFDYFAGTGGTVAQSTSGTNLLFNNIVVRGFSNSAPFTTVAQNSTPPGMVDFSGFQFVRASLATNDPQNANGFVGAQKFSWTPQLQFGGTNSTSGTGEFYVKGGMCRALGKITGKGSATGGATITLPIPTRSDSSLQPIGKAVGISGMASLAGSIECYMNSGSNILNLATQGAAGANTLSDGNFTGTPVLIFDVTYPV